MSKRDDILNATFELIDEQGLQSVTFAKIFKRANVGSGTVYNYFADKDELVSELYIRIAAHMAEIMGMQELPDGSVYERFLFFAENFLNYAVQYPKHLAFLENYSHSPYLSDTIKNAYNPGMAELYEVFEQGQHDGVIQQMPPKLCAQIMFGVIIYSVRGAMNGKYILGDLEKRLIIEAAWKAVKA